MVEEGMDYRLRKMEWIACWSVWSKWMPHEHVKSFVMEAMARS